MREKGEPRHRRIGCHAQNGRDDAAGLHASLALAASSPEEQDPGFGIQGDLESLLARGRLLAGGAQERGQPRQLGPHPTSSAVRPTAGPTTAAATARMARTTTSSIRE